MRRLFIGLLTCVLLCFSWTARALDEFVISDVRVEGLQKISAGTVFNYLPLKVGDRVTKETARESIRALFETGFFRDVQLEQDGTVLIVVVQERSSIANISYIGNKQIDDEELTKALEQFDVSQGRIFDQSAMDRVTQEIKALYFSQGRYSAKVTTTVTPLDNNRLSITINIDEGEIAKIKQIKILGNKIFTTKQLLKEFKLAESSAIRFYSKKDRYSKQKLSADLESLRSFYQDQGFLDFKLESSQVSISPDKKGMFITIKLFEGERHVISGFSVSGQNVVPNSELVALVSIKKGDVFSRRALSRSRRALVEHLSDNGYAFATVNMIPKVDKEKQTVEYNFIVDVGKRVYVRRIDIHGNTTTRDEVIRREFRQFEGGWYSASKVRRSRVRLQRLGYFEDLKIETPSVPGTNDQVDVVVTVVEKPTGSFTLGIGFSDDEGVLLQLGVNERNLLGSGKELGLRFDNSSVSDVIDLSYNNPFYKRDGTSRGFNFVRRTVDATETLTADYLSETIGLGVNYRFPISEFNSLRAGLDVEEVTLKETNNTPPEIETFIVANPDSINYRFVSSIAHDTRDSLIFPTVGVLRRLTLEVTLPGSDLEFYKVSVRGSYYRPLSRFFTFKVTGDLGYGDGYGNLDELPFYKNYFAGGSSTVRGFDSRSLGPRDSTDDPDPLGGSTRVLGNMEIIIGATDKEGASDKRIALFVDTGMVYGADEDIDLDELRVSTGAALQWLTPLGPLSISYGIPLNDKDGDDVEKIQFTLGTPFR